MTLDEYKREQEQKRSRASFNIRKPGEGGEEKAEWKRMFVLKKKVSDEDGEDAEDDDEDDSEVGALTGGRLAPCLVGAGVLERMLLRRCC